MKADETGIEFTNELPLLGIGAAPDATNRLALASAASLFNHDGAGHQHKINKNAAADTASILFQTGFSGRAELGTTGDDDWHVKVSPDGTTWYEAIVADKDTGAVSVSALSASASARSPVVVGGTGAASSLKLRSTSGSGTSDAIVFEVGNDGATEAARFKSDGHFYVGSPVSLSGAMAGGIINIAGSGLTDWAQVQGAFGDDPYSIGIAYAKSRNATVGSHTIVQDGDQLGAMVYWGSDGSDWVQGGYFLFEVDGSPARLHARNRPHRHQRRLRQHTRFQFPQRRRLGGRACADRSHYCGSAAERRRRRRGHESLRHGCNVGHVQRHGQRRGIEQRARRLRWHKLEDRLSPGSPRRRTSSVPPK